MTDFYYGNGSFKVCFGNANGSDNNDTSSNFETVYEITNSLDDSAIIVKYDTNGLFLWTYN